MSGHHVTVQGPKATCECGWSYLPANAGTLADRQRKATYAGFDHIGDWNDVPTESSWPLPPIAAVFTAIIASAAVIAEPRAFPLVVVWIGLILWTFKGYQDRGES